MNRARAGCEPAECDKSRKIDMSDCSKIRYASRGAAITAMRAIARKYSQRDRACPTGTYLCSPCRSWHLTSKSGNQIPPWVKARVRR